MLETLTGISHRRLTNSASLDLIRAVIGLRSVKTEAEIREIEAAIAVSRQLYAHVSKTTRPGIYEQQLAGQLTGMVNAHGRQIAFPTILTIHGETLHQRHQQHRMSDTDLLLIDSGTQSTEYYASDITRTFPVGGRFTPRQKAIYEVVLKTQTTGIENTRPGVRYKDAHIAAAEAMVDGLKALGLMRGDVVDAVHQGAHALFFPHGLGHMLGLDVHDMESLGEDVVGYDDQTRRSGQFGLSSLRMGRQLKPGFVVTAEPGIYFIPMLIEQWKAEKRCTEFINYGEVEKYRGFGGIRIEDDVLITRNGCRVLSHNIPKAVDKIESIISV
jgi:Xaa-Pro aminopeptidase